MKRSFSLSIKQLALVFVAGLILIMSLLGVFALYQSHTAADSLARHRQQAAAAELQVRLDKLLDKIDSQAAQLANWDETRQQLVLPAYYAYWHGTRVHEAGILPKGQARVALYTPDGSLLAPHSGARSLPAQLNAAIRRAAPATWLAQVSGTPTLHRSFPIYLDDGGQKPAGYGLLQQDILPALLQGDFQFVDPASIRLPLAAGETLTASELPARLRFMARPDPDQLRYQTIFSRTLLALFALLGAAALAGYWLYQRALARPLRQLTRDIEAMQETRLPPQLHRPGLLRITEIDNVRRSLHDYQLQLRDLHGTLKNQNREFHSQARQDVLTGCYNRRAYEEDWADFRAKLASSPQGVAFLLFDCDRFKAINDTYGHAKGDRVLCIIVDAVVMALRANDRLYRLGGDEFATFLARTTPAQAKQIGQRCQSLIDAARFTDLGINEPVGISIGIAFCETGRRERLDELPKQADIAMYVAKQPGHKRIAVYGEDTDSSAQTLVANRETSALFQALAQPGMIEMHYQPIHRLPQRKVEYYEALARIRHKGNLLMPGDFFPVVASRRLETEFDLAVLNQVDADLAAQRLPAGSGVSVNISAQSISRPEAVSALMELSRHATRHPLTLEITETSLITQIQEVRTYLELLHTVNYKIAMDDFGTGFSPLRYLVDLPVDVIKFDISLIGKLETDSRASRLVADFARMLLDAGYSLVAEGVENEAVLERVQALGFAHVQGYLLGRPQTVDQLALRDAPADSVLA
jgi:diguanylate cyclase (GGDEF)-like protein